MTYKLVLMTSNRCLLLLSAYFLWLRLRGLIYSAGIQKKKKVISLIIKTSYAYKLYGEVDIDTLIGKFKFICPVT